MAFLGPAAKSLSGTTGCCHLAVDLLPALLFRLRLISSGEGKKRISLIMGLQFWVCSLELKLLVWGGARTGRSCALPLQGDELSPAPRNKQRQGGRM